MNLHLPAIVDVDAPNHAWEFSNNLAWNVKKRIKIY